MPFRRRKVAILGARSLAAQWLVRLLENHPWFELSALTSSEAIGKRYFEAVKWLAGSEPPEYAANLELAESDPKKLDADIVFSLLPGEVALKLEPEFAKAGFAVISRAAPYRYSGKVPVIVPEVNPEHLALLEHQQELWSGVVVADPNCTTTILALPLKPLHDTFKVKKVVASTLQAASGAGYPGVPSLELIDNVVPYIPGEEERTTNELLMLMGKVSNGSIEKASFETSLTCTRVPVLEGHLASVFLETEYPAKAQDAMEILREFRGKPQELGLPTAPRQPIIVLEDCDRPQPRLDRLRGDVNGMSVVVGRVRGRDTDHSILFVTLGHNLVRGAAGSSLLLAELLVAEGYA
ncbi:MAG: aspartate-semialdehyde dehydrogenase [Thermofilaceae archaeon]